MVPATRAGCDLFLPGVGTEAVACVSTWEETKCEFAAVCDSSCIYISNPCSVCALPSEHNPEIGSVLPAVNLPAFSRKLCLAILCA